jgi:hypothetical protein
LHLIGDDGLGVGVENLDRLREDALKGGAGSGIRCRRRHTLYYLVSSLLHIAREHMRVV